jgi:hypothetical protein
MTEIDETMVLDASERISRYSKYLYEETSQGHKQDELQMLIDKALIDLLEAISIDNRDIEVLELNPVEKKLGYNAIEESFHFKIPGRLKNYLHRYEEKHGLIGRKDFHLTGSKWIWDILKHSEQLNKDKGELIQNLHKINNTLENQIKDFTILSKILSKIGIDINTDNYTYFLESEGFVKIGRSIKPLERFNNIKTNSPHEVKFLFAFKSPEDVENLLHSHFKENRHRGEWFEKTYEFDKLLVELKYVLNPNLIIKGVNCFDETFFKSFSDCKYRFKCELKDGA